MIHHFLFSFKQNYTVVREVLGRKFVENYLPMLMSMSTHANTQLPGVTDWLKDDDNEPRLDDDSGGKCVQVSFKYFLYFVKR